MYLRQGLSINDCGHLVIGGCDSVQLAKEYGTPLYVYDENYMRDRCRQFVSAMDKYAVGGHVCFASKAFGTTAMFKLVNQEGLWLDVVSAGELIIAKRAGMPMEHITLHGSNKTMEEIELAVAYGVGRIVIDNKEEITLINNIARKVNTVANVLLRVNPGVDAHTHSYIQTARVDSKFGVGLNDGEALSTVAEILAASNLCLKGLHMHIGSQIFNSDAFVSSADIATTLIAQIKKELSHEIGELNAGGGYSVHYTDKDNPVEPDVAVKLLAQAIEVSCAKKGISVPQLSIEPGRAVVAEACIMLYSIGAIKTIPGIRTYVSIDGGMADNPRPALYQAVYDLAIANKMNEEPTELVTISGRTCETDTMFSDVLIQKPQRDDVFAVFTSGAYQYVMASNYNKLPIPAVVFVKDGKSSLVVKRQNIEDLMGNDVTPEWF